MTSEPWTILGAAGEPIIGDAHLPAPGIGEPVGVLVCCHGFKGYKDYGFFPQLAEAAARSGLIAHRFNFSHSGMTNRIETFERPDLFSLDRWSYQIADLLAVVSAIREGELAGENLPIVWFGHSRGGVTCVLTGQRVFEDDELASHRPAGIVTAAAPHEAMHLEEEHKRILRKTGRLSSPSSRTGQDLQIGLPFLEEVESAPHAYDPVRCIARIACPMLILHGSDDPTVPVESAHALSAAAKHAQLEVLDGANHVFNAPNPLPLDTPAPPTAQRMIDMVCEFATTRCRHPAV